MSEHHERDLEFERVQGWLSGFIWGLLTGCALIGFTYLASTL